MSAVISQISITGIIKLQNQEYKNKKGMKKKLTPKKILKVIGELEHWQ